MASYPGSIASFSAPSSTSPTNSPSHAGLHAQETGEIVAIETELGINPSGAYATVASAITTLGTIATTAKTQAQALTTWIAGSASAGTAYVVAPFAGAITGYWTQGGAAPAVPGLVTVIVGSAGAVLLTYQPTSAGIAGAVGAMTNTSGTTMVAAGASMSIVLGASGTAFQQSVTLCIARTA